MELHLEFTFIEGGQNKVWWEKNDLKKHRDRSLAIGLLFATWSPTVSEGKTPRQLKNPLPLYILLHKKIHELKILVI